MLRTRELGRDIVVEMLRRTSLRWVVEEIAYAFVLLIFARWTIGLRHAGTFVWPHVTPDALLHGDGPTPFQYRALTPWIARLVVLFTHNTRVAFDVVEAVAAAGHVLTFRAHMTALVRPAGADDVQHEAARRFGIIVSPLAAAMIPLQYVLLGEVLGMGRYVYFPWDVPGALGFMGCVMLLHARRWGLYYPCFVLATLTRETTCFLPLLLLFDGARGESERRLAAHIAAQFGLWILVKIALRWIYRNNPGDGAWVDTLDDNLLVLANPGSTGRVLGCFAFLWVPAVVFARSIEDRFTRRALWVIPVWFVGMMRVGNVYELRIFGELTAVVFPAWLLALRASLLAGTPSPSR
jgi:hypothetical protein